MHRNWVFENINKVAEKLGFPKRDYTPLVVSDGDKFSNVVHTLPRIPAAHVLSLALLFDLIVEEIAEIITELKQYEPVRLTVYQPAKVSHE